MPRKVDLFKTVKDVSVRDPFFSRIQNVVIDTMILYQKRALNDEIPDVKKSHCIENFRIAAGRSSGEYYGRVFQDSDLAKWIEAVAYSLVVKPDPDLEAQADEAIDLIGEAQQEDGYLNTYFTVKEPEHRWQNLADCHEMYCAGHMTEAGVAYYLATGKDKLLKIVCRLCDHIERRFGPGKVYGIPGHEEIELALLRLYRVTKEKKYLDLAKYFIDQRGQDPEFFIKEAKERGWKRVQSDETTPPTYMQNHKPVREMDTVEGHAVRCMYLLTAVADLAAETDDDELFEACRRLWENMTERRMYITAGIGSTAWGEAFTRDFDLPNDTAYAETCAAVGVCFFARQMLEAEPDGRYADVMERALYNGTISGMELDGTKFFYVNQLEADPHMRADAYYDEEYTVGRTGWYDCACCPPNLARLMTGLGGYIWSENEDTLYSHLFIGSTVKAGNGAVIELQGGYPWNGDLTYTVKKAADKPFKLAIRLPGWCENFSLTVNGKAADAEEVAGYLVMERDWQPGDVVSYILELKPVRVYADPRVKDDVGCVALMRGPVVYAFEGVDNGKDLSCLRLPNDAEIQALPYDPALLEGVVALTVAGKRAVPEGGLYGYEETREEDVTLKAIPYYAWANRGSNPMRVWIRE